MSDGREDEELGMSVPLDDESSDIVLESHDPETGMGTFRMPDQTTMDVHLPSAGIVPHEDVPVRPSPGARVPVTSGHDWVRDPSRFSESEPLSSITAQRVSPVIPAAPPSIAISEEEVARRREVQRALEQQRAEDAAQRERERIYHEVTIPEWSRRQEAARLAEEERLRAEDAAAHERGRSAASEYQQALIDDYNQAQEQERHAMEDITAAPLPRPEVTPAPEATTTVTPHSVGILTLPDGTQVFTDAQGNEISRRQAFEDGMIASPTSQVVPEGTRVLPQTGHGTLVHPDGSYTFTDERGDQYSFDAEGNPIDFREADGIVARQLPIHEEDVIPSRSVPVDRSSEAVRRQALADRLEGRTLPVDQEQLASMGYGESVEPSTQMSVAPLYSSMPSTSGARPFVGPTLEQAGLTPESLVERRRGITSAPTSRRTVARRTISGPPAPLTDEQFIDQLTQRPRGAAQTSISSDGRRLPSEISDQDIQTLAGREPQREPDLFERQYNVAAKTARLQADAARQQADAEAAYERQRRELEQERQLAEGRAARRYQDAIDRVANYRIDPTRFFRDRGAAGMIGSAISVALGALGNVYTGGTTNLGLEQINRAVDRDISAQEQEMGNLRSVAGMQENMFGIMRQQFSDRQAALDATRAGMLQQVALQIQEQEAGLADAEAQNHAEELRQQALAAAEEARQSAIDRQSQIDLRTAQAQRLLAQGELSLAQADTQTIQNQRRLWLMQHPQARHQDTNPVTTAQMESYQRQIEAHVDPAIAARQAFEPDQYYYNNPPPQAPISGPERQHLEELNTALQTFRDHLFRDEEGDIPGFGLTGRLPGAVVSEEGRRNRRLFENLVNAFAHARTGAAMTDEERQEISEVLGGDWFNTDADLESAVNDIVVPIVENALSRQANSSASSRTEEDIQRIAPGAREIEE